MTCPNCHAFCGENDRFCSYCGQPFQRKTGSHRIPILVLVILSVLGIGVYFATRNAPDTDLSETPWFQVWEGYLYFDGSLYTGDSQVVVPSEIDGKTVYGLSDGCFENCTDITTVILPDTLTEINNDAFAGCTSLRGIYLPENVYVIGAGAFSGCTELEAICIPSSIRYIGPDTFDGCGSLVHIFFDGSYTRWLELYDEFINQKTAVYCEDGSFYHGGSPFQ